MSQPQVPRPGHSSLLHAVATALLVIAATPSIAGADGPEGAFVGASVGQNNGSAWVFGPEESGYPQLTVELSETTWRVFGGYRWRQAGVECGYRDLGTAEDTVEGFPVSVSSKGWDAFAVGLVPLGRLELFGKLGMYFHDLERSDPSSPSAYVISGLNTPIGAVGVSVRWPAVSLRLEWERSFDAEYVSAVSVGVVLHLTRP